MGTLSEDVHVVRMFLLIFFTSYCPVEINAQIQSYILVCAISQPILSTLLTMTDTFLTY